MPLYDFQCKSCDKKYEEFSKYDATEKYTSVKCPHCNSKKKSKIPSRFSMKFDDPKSSSKWDNFSYRAGFNMEKAQDERRSAEQLSHMGSSDDIYNNMNDENVLGEGLHE